MLTGMIRNALNHQFRRTNSLLARTNLSTTCAANLAFHSSRFAPITYQILSAHPPRSVSVRQLYRSSETLQDLSYEDLIALMRGGDIHLIDVREPEEIKETGMIPGAINVPLGQVKTALQLPDEIFQARFKQEKPQKYDSNLVFYGLGPIKSGAAVELARKAGYMNAREYSKGWEEWSKHCLD